MYPRVAPLLRRAQRSAPSCLRVTRAPRPIADADADRRPRRLDRRSREPARGPRRGSSARPRTRGRRDPRRATKLTDDVVRDLPGSRRATVRRARSCRWTMRAVGAPLLGPRRGPSAPPRAEREGPGARSPRRSSSEREGHPLDRGDATTWLRDATLVGMRGKAATRARCRRPRAAERRRAVRHLAFISPRSRSGPCQPSLQVIAVGPVTGWSLQVDLCH